MTQISPMTSQIALNGAIVNTTGGTQLATGGGCIAAPPAVLTAGSSNASATLYDGSSTSGQPLATFSLGIAGPTCMPNSGFANGLFVEITGSEAGAFQITYTGQAA